MHTKNSVKNQCVANMSPGILFRLKNCFVFRTAGLFTCLQLLKKRKTAIVVNIYVYVLS